MGKRRELASERYARKAKEEEERYASILAAREQGMGWERIAAEFKCSKRTIVDAREWHRRNNWTTHAG
jgi:hypothetical protein